MVGCCVVVLGNGPVRLSLWLSRGCHPRQPVCQSGVHPGPAGTRSEDPSMYGNVLCTENIFEERLQRGSKYEEVYLKADVNAVEARRGLGGYFRFKNNLGAIKSWAIRSWPMFSTKP